MLRWYGRRGRERGRRPRVIGCLLWLVALIVLLIVASLLFGGFTKGSKAAGLSRAAPAAPLAAGPPASPPRR